MKEIVKPPRLTLPAPVSVVAPASPMDGHKIHPGLERLRELGLNPLYDSPEECDCKYLAGTDRCRAEKLEEAFLTDRSDAVFCVRGGYGTSRLLELINFQTIKDHPKAFVGYSDITFLHCALWARSGLVTFHGPTISQVRMLPEDNLQKLIEVLASDSAPTYSFPTSYTLREGKAEGRVMGGNLTCLCHLLGTPFEPDLNGAILLIEDRGEQLYRIDRMLMHLKLAGKFDTIKGVLIGEFLSCGQVTAIWDLVTDLFTEKDIPILAGIPVGHGSKNIVLPLGVLALMDASRKTLTYLESPTNGD